MSTNSHRGSSFDDFLAAEGLLDEVTLVAKKRAIAIQLAKALKASRLPKADLAARMDTSRAQLNRLLDPDNESVTLRTMFRAGKALGLELQIAYVPMKRSKKRKTGAPAARLSRPGKRTARA